MFLIVKPPTARIQKFIEDQSLLEYSYDAIGARAKNPPPGYIVEHRRVQLGKGESIFAAARTALQRWRHFDLSWVELHRAGTPIQKGETVAMLAKGLFGIWSLNACRIVYVVDEDGPWTRFGFVYGTLPDHIGAGEERFVIEWNHDDDSVWYDIFAFSRANHWLGWLFYPYLRYKQKQFKQESAAALRQAVHETLQKVAHETRSDNGHS